MQCGYSPPRRMDSIDSIAAVEISKRDIQIWMEPIKFNCFSENESVC